MATDAAVSEVVQDVFIEVDGKKITNQCILADLCVTADSPEVRDCLRAYKLHTNTKQLKCIYGPIKKSTIVDTLKFLQAPARNWNNYVKDACVHELICRIQNLLIDTCQFCSCNYATGKDDILLLQCCICGQSAHKPCLQALLGEKYSPDLNPSDVKKLINPFNIASLHFLCQSCSNNEIPKASQGLKKAAQKIAQDTSTDADVTNDGTRVNNSVVLPPSQPPLQNSQSTEELEVPPNSLSGETVIEENTVNESPVDKVTEKKNICRYYARGMCKYGKEGNGCSFDHPIYCKKLLNHGTSSQLRCDKGSSCNHFHPKMCHRSIAKKECFNDRCPYFHIKGTKRHPHRPQKVSHHPPGVDHHPPRHSGQNYYRSQSCNSSQHPPWQSGENLYPSKRQFNQNPANEFESIDFLSMFHQMKEELFQCLDKRLQILQNISHPQNVIPPVPTFLDQSQQFHGVLQPNFNQNNLVQSPNAPQENFQIPY